MQPTTTPEERIAALEAEIERLRDICAEAYELAGTIGAPIRVLDNLSAAAHGGPIPHPTFLPIAAEDCAECGTKR